MCLALPVQIIERKGERALANRNGLELEVDVSLLPEAKAGDYVVVHVGIALSMLTPEEVQETLSAFASIEADA